MCLNGLLAIPIFSFIFEIRASRSQIRNPTIHLNPYYIYETQFNHPTADAGPGMPRHPDSSQRIRRKFSPDRISGSGSIPARSTPYESPVRQPHGRSGKPHGPRILHYFRNRLKRQTMNKLGIISLLLISAAGCSEHASEEGTGRLQIRLDVDPSVTVSQTKSSDATTFTLEISRDGDIVRTISPIGETPDPIELTAGDYLLTAYSEPFETPQFDTPVYGGSAPNPHQRRQAE